MYVRTCVASVNASLMPHLRHGASIGLAQATLGWRLGTTSHLLHPAVDERESRCEGVLSCKQWLRGKKAVRQIRALSKMLELFTHKLLSVLIHLSSETRWKSTCLPTSMQCWSSLAKHDKQTVAGT